MNDDHRLVSNLLLTNCEAGSEEQITRHDCLAYRSSMKLCNQVGELVDELLPCFWADASRINS
jgi:hypothetical protein